MIYYFRRHRIVPLFQLKHVLIHFTPDFAKWGDLRPFTWGGLSQNTWGIPLGGGED